MPRNKAVAALVLVLAYLWAHGDLPLGSASPTSTTLNGCAVEATVPAQLGFDDGQVDNAAIIAQVGVDMQMPRRAVVVALATAMQESGLRNLDYGDRDSLGLFQQRPSQGWGTARQVRDPEYASRKFYQALRNVDGWQRMRVTEAAQAVQRSAYPEAYQKHVDAAGNLTEALLKEC